jgi:hypothetical protein
MILRLHKGVRKGLLLMAFFSSCFFVDASELDASFTQNIEPLLKTYCVPCHNVDKMKSGVRVDHLDGKLEDRSLRLWETIEGLVADHEMPPEDEKQPSTEERALLTDWISNALHEVRSREVARDGSVRRLTVAQYRNALWELLDLEDDFTDLLPPEAISRDGFENNKDAMLLSPLLLETYFEIAEKALDRSLVDEASRPTIQNFRMDLGKGINPDPLPEPLILGAASRLLPNDSFTVTELTPRKPFPYEPFVMQKKFRFVEGYKGNSTVRGWRDYDSIYHAVYACMRGSGGYPLGNPYDLVLEGLLLRPAIPSAELFQVESTYGPKANFKISLRQLPDGGRFRVTVHAAKYDDGLLLTQDTEEIGEGIVVELPKKCSELVRVEEAGVYQVEVYREPPPGGEIIADGTKMDVGRIGSWSFDDGPAESPFGRSASIKENEGAIVIPADESFRVGADDFTVAAWIRPNALKQGGIVAKGPYGRKGWVFDMPDGTGVLRVETFKGYQQGSGTVRSKPGIIRKGQWQHVAAVVKRGDGGTRLYVNGYEVASGSVEEVDLDNPDFDLHVGRIPNANHFSGEIDEVQVYRRALGVDELQFLIEPGRQFAQAPPDGKQGLTVELGDRSFSGTFDQAPFVAVRLAKGPLRVATEYSGTWKVNRVVLAPMSDPTLFEQFEKRSPILGVHFGLRRDCGHTLNPVGSPRMVSSGDLKEFVFEGAINNFPSPDVEKNNVNYISGLREIGVRSEYADGRSRSRLLVRSIEFEGPLYDSWPPASHRKIFSGSDPHRVIQSFASRAFRRPIEKEEETFLIDLYERSFAESGNAIQSVRDVLMVILTSPQFLFLIEESEGPQSERIEPYELVSKLAFFLWNGTPDRRLLDLAGANAIHESLDSEIDRMIDDPRFERFSDAFVSQWLSLDKLDTVETDREQFPELTRDVKSQLRLEPIRFVEHLIRANLPLRHLVKSNLVVANEIVATYYGLGDRIESGFGFQAFQHRSPHLGGLLSQAGILAALSDGREANPIKRGAWLARKMIAEPPADPPPNVPELSEEEGHLTLRERLGRHRNQEGCVKCHEGIDPWGFPLEQFDAGGRFMNDPSHDASSILPDETEITDLNHLKDYLSGERIDQVAFSFLKHLATYAVGRDLSYNEVESLREKALDSKDTKYQMRDLLRFVIYSDIFQKK